MNITDQNKQIKTSFGPWLKEKRIAQKISLEAVSAKTSIRPSILEAIEAEVHEKLPAKVYTVGFIRAYARELGLDPDEGVRRYHLHQDCEADEKKEPGWNRTYEKIYTKPTLRFRWGFYPLAGLALVLVAWLSYFWLWPQIAKRLPSHISTGTVQSEVEQPEATASVPTDNAEAELAKEMAVVGPTAEPAGENAAIPANSNPIPRALTFSEKETPDTAVDPIPEPEPVPISETIDAKTLKPTETAARQPPETKPMDLSSGFELTIDALATTWLKVTPDDGPPKEYTLHEGNQKEFQVSSQVQLSIGNAGGIALTVNGQPYPIAGKSGEVVHLTIP